MNTKAKVEELLKSSINIEMLEVRDDSHLHASHRESTGEGGTHFSITIISKDFNGKTPVQRHRMIYKILDQSIQRGIHALAIQARTPDEKQ